MFAKQKLLAAALEEGDSEEENEVGDTVKLEERTEELSTADYGGGKWGRFLRAPDFYPGAHQE
jgi:hypothetical protein